MDEIRATLWRFVFLIKFYKGYLAKELPYSTIQGIADGKGLFVYV